ncbi:DivIVA domain-containing protein [Christensenellaceae bacterium OttesenSCG-928-M15]|nr:DivIVA domain-containing protein [Christensenellaceae bacterium OttesenSCG-928-M15]
MRADDIVRQRFTKVFRGYDVQEVDLFLDDVIETFDRMEDERNGLLARLERLMQELERCDGIIHEYEEKEKRAKLSPMAPDREEAAPVTERRYIGGNRLKRVVSAEPDADMTQTAVRAPTAEENAGADTNQEKTEIVFENEPEGAPCLEKNAYAGDAGQDDLAYAINEHAANDEHPTIGSPAATGEADADMVMEELAPEQREVDVQELFSSDEKLSWREKRRLKKQSRQSEAEEQDTSADSSYE